MLLGFPDNNVAADTGDICLLEYGTTDRWAAQPYDGTLIPWQVVSRALTFSAIERTKQVLVAHARIRMKYQGGAVSASMYVGGDIFAANSPTRSFPGSNVGLGYFDMKAEINASATQGGDFEENAPQLYLSGSCDLGCDLLNWWVKARVQEFAVDRQV